MSYKEQLIWKKAINLAVQCYKLTEYFPKSEIYGITSQIRESSISIASNIAKSFREKEEIEYMNFLDTALGAAGGLDTQLIITIKVELGKKEYINSVINDVEEMQNLLVLNINKLTN
jgi:four helix bundle protein